MHGHASATFIVCEDCTILARIEKIAYTPAEIVDSNSFMNGRRSDVTMGVS
jgi:hypothetical protein